MFVRPEAPHLEPGVFFYDRPAEFRDGGWQHIGGPAVSGAALAIRNQVHLYDAHAEAGDVVAVARADRMRQWLYVMDGEIDPGAPAFAGGSHCGNGIR